MGRLPDVQSEQVGASQGTGDRANHARRVQAQLGRLQLRRGQAQAALCLDALGPRPQYRRPVRFAGICLALLGQRQQGWQKGRHRVVGREPHGLKIQHMHGHAVDPRGGSGMGSKALADHRGRAGVGLGAGQTAHQDRPGLMGASDGNGNAVGDQQAATLQQCGIVGRPGQKQLGEFTGQVGGHGISLNEDGSITDRPAVVARSPLDTVASSDAGACNARLLETGFNPT